MLAFLCASFFLLWKLKCPFILHLLLEMAVAKVMKKDTDKNMSLKKLWSERREEGDVRAYICVLFLLLWKLKCAFFYIWMPLRK